MYVDVKQIVKSCFFKMISVPDVKYADITIETNKIGWRINCLSFDTVVCPLKHFCLRQTGLQPTPLNNKNNTTLPQLGFLSCVRWTYARLFTPSVHLSLSIFLSLSHFTFLLSFVSTLTKLAGFMSSPWNIAECRTNKEKMWKVDWHSKDEESCRRRRVNIFFFLKETSRINQL